MTPQSWSPTQVIGDAIRKMIQFFKMYRSYTANYERSQITLSENLRKNSAFQVSTHTHTNTHTHTPYTYTHTHTHTHTHTIISSFSSLSLLLPLFLSHIPSVICTKMGKGQHKRRRSSPSPCLSHPASTTYPQIQPPSEGHFEEHRERSP